MRLYFFLHLITWKIESCVLCSLVIVQINKEVPLMVPLPTAAAIEPSAFHHSLPPLCTKKQICNVAGAPRKGLAVLSKLFSSILFSTWHHSPGHDTQHVQTDMIIYETGRHLHHCGLLRLKGLFPPSSN